MGGCVIGISPCRNEHLSHVPMTRPGRLMQWSEATRRVLAVDPVWIFTDESLHRFHIPYSCCTVQPGARFG